MSNRAARYGTSIASRAETSIGKRPTPAARASHCLPRRHSHPAAKMPARAPNWPTVTELDQIARLFVGVNAVGLWDELFFICVVFALLRRHFPFWQANVLQAVVFVSFLWELGYRGWGPVLTVPFALLQGYIFQRTRSLTYVVTVHLSFDLIIFMILVHAHTPAWFDIFPPPRCLGYQT